MARNLLLVLLAAQACSNPTYDGDVPDGGNAQDGGDSTAFAAGDGTTSDARRDARVEGGGDAGGELISREDGGTPTETAPDGGEIPLASSMPDWAAPLLGRYAARSYQFSQDTFSTKIRSREYLLIDIVETGGADSHVELQLHMCDSFGEGTTANSQVAFPALSTPRIHRVLFGKESWATQTGDSVDGFTRALPERCQGKEGDAVEKDPAQTWIPGATCLCPPSIDSVPAKPDDCRIIDQDADGHPGSSLYLKPKVLGLGPATLYATTINRTTFVNGTVANNGRHTAQLAIDQTAWQLGCDNPAGCPDVAATPAPCPPSRNKLEMVPRDAIASCKELIDNAAALFPSGLPDYPAKCP